MLEPRATACVMHGGWILAVLTSVPTFEVIPSDGQRPDDVIRQPLEPVQKETGLRVDDRWRQLPNLLMGAVDEHEA